MKGRQVTLELAEKWWDLFKKNPTQLQVADWAARALSIALKYDFDGTDLKTRMGLADLLYQSNQFLAAAENYQIVSERSQDSNQIRLASYAWLISTEKADPSENPGLPDSKLVTAT